MECQRSMPMPPSVGRHRLFQLPEISTNRGATGTKAEGICKVEDLQCTISDDRVRNRCSQKLCPKNATGVMESTPAVHSTTRRQHNADENCRRKFSSEVSQRKCDLIGVRH
jgi:hypothetical protein